MHDLTPQRPSEAPAAGRRMGGVPVGAAGPAGATRAAGILALQSRAGNAAVARLLSMQRHAVPTAEPEGMPAPPGLDPSAAPPGQAQAADPSQTGGQAADQSQTGGQPAEAANFGPTGLPAGIANAAVQIGEIASPTTGAAAMNSAVAGARFAKEMVTEERQWATQASADARAHAINDMIGRRLSDAGVTVLPSYTLRTDLGASTLGSFGFRTWTVNINSTIVASATLTPAQADQIADTFYHEGRHCDQWFRMARLRTGQLITGGATAAAAAGTVATAMGIPNNVALAASAAPLAAASAEATEAQTWYDSVYGTNGAARNAIYAEMNAADAANAAAAAAYHASNTEADLALWRTANTRLQTAFAAYQALPEEVSARAAASSMMNALRLARAFGGLPADAPAPSPPGTPSGPGDFEAAPQPAGTAVA